MDEQMTIFDFCQTVRRFEDYVGDCKYCGRYREEPRSGQPGCAWAHEKAYLACHNKSQWQPNERAIPQLCGNCKYGNQFEYQTKPEYLEEEKRHNGYLRRAADDPVEEPNIYCTRTGGSVNRRAPFEKSTEPGFGIGHWDRQHEWDTCDAWELDTEFFDELRGLA